MIETRSPQPFRNSEASAARIVEKLQAAGFSAYFVGGCVRDRLMGIVPRDYDIATSAPPQQVGRLFPRTVAVGAAFGVVRVLEEGGSYEVATFRSDGSYPDGRRPSRVTYSTDPGVDVRRRDFTINGLLYDPSSRRILDFVGGERDIRSGVIRTIGSAERRFREDKLRLVRAVRFAARFGYELETETLAALRDQAEEVTRVSPERIREELVRMLTEGNAAAGIRGLQEVGLLVHLLPEVTDLQGVPQPPEFHPEGDCWVHTLLMLDLMDRSGANREKELPGVERRDLPGDRETTLPSVPYGMALVSYPSVTLAMGVLLHDIGKPSTFERRDRIRFNSHADVGARMALRVCERFRFSRKQQERITALVRDHLKFIDLPRMRASTLKRFLGQEGFEEHLELHRLDCLGSHGNLDNWRLAAATLDRSEPEELHPHPILTGNDLIQMGYVPGPVFREILSALRDAQLENRVKTRRQAKSWVSARFDPDPS